MNTHNPVVRSATTADIDEIALTLAQAFEDDPVKLHLVGGRSLPVERVAPFFVAFQKVQLPHGHVYTTTGHEAAALWAPPGHWKVPFTQILRHSPTFVKLYGRRFLPNLQVLAGIEKLHPTEPHYYLEFIGTASAHRGRGFAAALVQPMLDRADEEGVGMYLESSKESNIAYYARFGFEVRTEHRIRHGPTMWPMWRDPR